MNTAREAYTLAASRRIAQIQVVWHPHPFRVRYAIDGQGRPLLLCRAGGALDQALTDNDAAVLHVQGERKKIWIAGWAAPAADRAAALDFAAANPQGDLLDVGRGFGIYRVDVAEIRFGAGAGATIDIDVDDYLAACSEPVM